MIRSKPQSFSCDRSSIMQQLMLDAIHPNDKSTRCTCSQTIVSLSETHCVLQSITCGECTSKIVKLTLLVWTSKGLDRRSGRSLGRIELPSAAHGTPFSLARLF
eukprot:5859830-Amphidinium_carterae.1